MSNGTQDSDIQSLPNQAGLEGRIRALEKGVQRWRCLTAVGFLTAMGAFWIAIFGLGQLENTYFMGEMVATLPWTAPGAQQGDQLNPFPSLEGREAGLGSPMSDTQVQEDLRASAMEEAP